MTLDVNQEVKVEVSQEVQSNLNKFIKDLDESLDGGFEQAEIPAPPEDRSNPDEVRNWLKTIDETLTRAESISDSAKSLAPYAKGLLAMLMV